MGGFLAAHQYWGWALFGLAVVWHIGDKAIQRGDAKKLLEQRSSLREDWLRLQAWERQLINIENAIDDSKKPE
jgi:hypothetical protein